MSIRVLIADDHRLFREGLRKVLEIEQDIVVVGEAVNGDDAVRCASELSPDVVLLDIDMPGPGMPQVVRAITGANPLTAVLLLTVHSEVQLVVDGLRAGASGYAMKDIDCATLVRAIKESLRGEIFVQDCLVGKVLKEFVKALRQNPKAPVTKGELDVLTPREVEVLALIGQGMTNRAISESLFISEKTVKNHVSSIFRKLDLGSRSEAAAYAVQNGLVGNIGEFA